MQVLRTDAYLPDFRVAVRLADALGVSVAYFYAEDERLAQMILAFHTLSATQQSLSLMTLNPLLFAEGIGGDKNDKDMKSKLAKRFGQVLRKYRRARGLSQLSLALDTELDRTYISLLERGLRQPSLSTVILLAHGVGVEPWQLVKETAPSINQAKDV